MKKLLLLICLLPLFAQAQVNGTIQLTTGTSIIRGSFGASGIDTLVRYFGPTATVGQLLRYNSTAKGWEAYTPTFGTGSVTSVSVTTANGVSGSVATSTTTPAITLTLGAITPTSTNGVSAATMAFNDATSSIQTQLNAKQATLTPAALTKTDDTNITLTLGGTPATALLQSASITAGWTGTLSPARGGTGVNNSTRTITISSGNLNVSTGGTLNLNSKSLNLNGDLTLNTPAGESTTLAITGTTSVTLPTTGTLATTAGNVATATALQNARTIGTATGDVTSAGSSFNGTANNTNALTLATVNSNVGSFGSATQSLSATVNAKGLVTAMSAQTVTPSVGSITGLGTGIATALAVNVGTAGSPVINGGVLGTPSSGVATNLTGTASGLTAGNVTTNANLTGVITSSGNATSIASQTGTGNTFVVQNTPTLTTPNIGVATGTSLTTTGKMISNDADGIANNVSTDVQMSHSMTRTGTNAAAWYWYVPSGSTSMVFFGGGSDRLSLSASGVVNIPNLTASQLVVTDASKNLVSGGAAPTSGTYTPTFTNGANVTSVTNTSAHYIRTGNQVFVELEVTMNTTLGANTSSQFQVSLPIASAFTLTTDAVGHGNCSIGTVLVTPVTLSANPTPDNILVGTFAIGTSNTVSFSFTYTVQ